ncbi:MAG: hypothetical protein R3325_00730 [Thermoanaerobaculia bacterium]|nr:hypothetical protein [Thermoanaerobaculia bacterium]
MRRWKSMATITLWMAVGGAGFACGSAETSAGSEVGDSEGSAAPDAAPAPPTGLAAEPILYSDADVVYTGFGPERLGGLHAVLTELTGDRVQLRVIPYLGRDADTGETVLKGETLFVYTLQPDADLAALRSRGDQVVARVRETFPDLGEGYSVELYARLPDGRTVADLEPELATACGDPNTVRTGVRLAEYEPGNPDDRFRFLCDGAKVLDRYFIDEEWGRLPGLWRTTAERGG